MSRGNLGGFRPKSTKFIKTPAQFFFPQNGLKNQSNDLKKHQTDTNPENSLFPFSPYAIKAQILRTVFGPLCITSSQTYVDTTRSLLDIPRTFAMTYSERPVFPETLNKSSEVQVAQK